MGRRAALPEDHQDDDATADTAGEEANAENTEADDTPQAACAILLRLAHVSDTAATLAMVAACALTAVLVRFARPAAAFSRRGPL